MKRLLMLPDSVKPETSEEELVKIFFGRHYMMVFMNDDFASKEKEVLELIQPINGDQTVIWRAIWLATLAVSCDERFGSIRDQIESELDEIETMSREEFEHLIRLLSIAYETVYHPAPLFNIPVVVHQVIGDEGYVMLPAEYRSLVYQVVDQDRGIFRANHAYFKTNKYFNPGRAIMDVMEIVLSDPESNNIDLDTFLIAAFHMLFGWRSDLDARKQKAYKQIKMYLNDAINSVEKSKQPKVVRKTKPKSQLVLKERKRS